MDTAAQGSTFDISNTDRLGKSEVHPPKQQLLLVLNIIHLCVDLMEDVNFSSTGGTGADSCGLTESAHSNGEEPREGQLYRPSHPQVEQLTRPIIIHVI